MEPAGNFARGLAASVNALENAAERGQVGVRRFLSFVSFCTFLSVAPGLACLLAKSQLK
jgi:hypothetical protein